MEWFLKCVKDNYANFNGRARRKEYWMFYLFFIIFSFVAMMLDGVLGTFGALYGLYVLALLVPALSVFVRRLHDINKSGWWYFISWIPLIGGIWLLVLLCTDGDKESNQYGEPTK